MTVSTLHLNPLCQIDHHSICDGSTISASGVCACSCHMVEDKSFFDRAMSKVMTDIAYLLWRSNRANPLSKPVVMSVVIDAMRECAGRHPGWNKEAAMNAVMWDVVQDRNWNRDRVQSAIKNAVMVDA